jgi:Tol biopolymer transport system component
MAHGEVTNSPTLTGRATEMGIVLGTAGYMAPEQAKGKSVDKRADIWAFGVVLYEMLTGQRAFKGDDISEILASVLKDTPSLDALPPTTPTRFVRLIARCLDRDLKTRLRDIGEARIEITRIETGAPDSVVMPITVSPATRPAWSRALAWALATAAALLAGALAIPAVRHLREAPAPEMRLEIVTSPTDRPTSFALSPDARQIVFVAAGDGGSRLWLRSLATTSAQPLAGTEGAHYPFWSPDGRSIGFFAAGALKRLDLGGGAPQTLAPASNAYGGTWSADGVIVFAPGGNHPLMRVSATGGDAVAVTTLLPRQIAHIGPHFLSDGFRFVFYVQGGADAAGLYLGALDGGTLTKLAADSRWGSAPADLPSGWLVWVRGRALVAQRLDLSEAALAGEPVTIAEGVDVVSASANGQIAYRSAANNQRQLTWVDRAGAVLGTVGDPGILSNPRVSPDGRRVVVERTVQGNVDLWLLDGTRASRRTVDAAADQFPIWSPDGARLAFRSLRSGPGDLYHQLVTAGPGTEERFVSTDQIKSPSSWSADGRFLLYLSIEPQTGGDLWVVPMTGEPTPAAFLKTSFREAYGAFSPDGRWVAYHSNESGRPEIYVRPFVPPGAPGTAAGAVQVSTTGGIVPVWRRDGKEIFYINPAGAMMAAPIAVTGATVEAGVPVMLFPTRIVGGGEDVQQGRQYDVAPDGRFLINTELDTGASPITLLMNWTPEGKK